MQSDILERNNVTVLGDGPRVMMLAHGFGCDQTVWGHMVDAFAPDHRLVLFDYVGSGQSDARAYDPSRYGSLDGYALDVLEICEALELRDVIFVGHSVSGMIGALASIQAPKRFSRLIMVGPSPCYVNEPPEYIGGFERADIDGLLEMMEHNYYGWAAFLAPLAMRNAERGELSSQVEASFCAMDPYIARRFAEVTFLSDHRTDLRRVITPTLVMQCSDDAIVPLSVGGYLTSRLPNGTLRVLHATGHFPHLSHPEETIAVMRDYLGEPVLA